MQPLGNVGVGQPIAGEPNRGGTEADGTISPDYCGFCYKDGEFTTPGVTWVKRPGRSVELTRSAAMLALSALSRR